MEARVDSGGRLLLPKIFRDTLGLTPGSIVNVSAYGSGRTVIPSGRTASIEETEEGFLVARGTGTVTDEDVIALIDAGRV